MRKYRLDWLFSWGIVLSQWSSALLSLAQFVLPFVMMAAGASGPHRSRVRVFRSLAREDRKRRNSWALIGWSPKRSGCWLALSFAGRSLWRQRKVDTAQRERQGCWGGQRTHQTGTFWNSLLRESCRRCGTVWWAGRVMRIAEKI